MFLRQLYDHDSSTYTYLIADPETREAALIDPVKEQAERDLTLVKELGFKLIYVFDTHVHADHVTAAGDLVGKTGARSVTSKAGASCAGMHVSHGDKLPLGSLTVEVLETPGHTDDSLSFRVGQAVFTGDALLIRGCGRTDFQNGDPGTLFDSVTGLLFALPSDTVVYPGHDYRGLSHSTIGEEQRHNPRLAGKSKAEFIELMNNLNLSKPKRIDEAVKANRVCGQPGAAFAGAPRANTGYFQLEAEQLLGELPPARIIDVREPMEFTGELGHIQGAELVPLSTVSSACGAWSHDDPVLVVCRSGRRSAAAAEQLISLGFERVANLEGGMLAYNRVMAGAVPSG